MNYKDIQNVSLILFAVGLVFVMAACEQPEPNDEYQKDALQKKELVIQLFDAFNSRDFDVIEGILADTVMYGDQQLEQADYMDLVQMHITAFPDIQAQVTQLLSDGDLTAALITYKGTGVGEYLGYDVDGKEVEWTNSYWYEISDNLIEGYKYNWDEFGFWKQLGVLESPYPEE